MGNPACQGQQPSASGSAAFCPLPESSPGTLERHPFRRAPMFPFLEEADRTEPTYSIWTRNTRQRGEAIFQPHRSPGEVEHTPPPRIADGSPGVPGDDSPEALQDFNLLLRRPMSANATPFKCPIPPSGSRRHKFKLRLGYDPRVFLEDPALRGQKLSAEAEKWAAAYRSRIPMVSDPQMSRQMATESPTWLGTQLDAQRAQVASRSLRQHLFAQPSDSEDEYDLDANSDGDAADAERWRAQATTTRTETPADRWPQRRQTSLSARQDAVREQRRASARAVTLLQARLARSGGATAPMGTLGAAQTAALMQEVANPDNRLPELLVELETRALALEQIRANSLVIARNERTRVRNVEHLSMDAMQRRVSRITNYLQRQTGVTLPRQPAPFLPETDQNAPTHPRSDRGQS